MAKELQGHVAPARLTARGRLRKAINMANADPSVQGTKKRIKDKAYSGTALTVGAGITGTVAGGPKAGAAAAVLPAAYGVVSTAMAGYDHLKNKKNKIGHYYGYLKNVRGESVEPKRLRDIVERDN